MVWRHPCMEGDGQKDPEKVLGSYPQMALHTMVARVRLDGG
jgi:hypothetical protein